MKTDVIMLRDRAHRLRELAASVFQADAKRDRHKNLSGRVEELVTHARNVAADRNAIEVLVDTHAVQHAEFSEIEVEQVHRAVRVLREEATDNPQALVSGNAFAQATTLVSRVHVQINNASTQAWKTVVREALSIVTDDDLALFREVDPAAVKPILALTTDLQRQRHLPPTRTEVEQFLEKARQLHVHVESAWRAVVGEASRSDILDFINAAKSENGADLASLTPEVVAWLTDKALIPRIGVKLRRAR